ncbi:unnamed protein product [Urochloa humidicola]
MSRTEEAIRRAGPLVALSAASALVLVLLPTYAHAAVDHRYVLTLPLFVAFMLGCAALPFSPAHRAATEASRETLAVPWRAATPTSRSWKQYWEALLGGLPLLWPLPPHPSSLQAPRCRDQRAVPRTEEAMRRAGALVALAAASALVLVLFTAPAAVERMRRYAVLALALFVSLLLGCAAVLLSPAHRGVAQLGRRAVEIFTVAWRGATDLRWVGFTGMLIYAVYVIGDVRKPAAAATKVSSVDMVNSLLPFLVFLAGALAVNLSMLIGRGSKPAPPPPPRAEE